MSECTRIKFEQHPAGKWITDYRNAHIVDPLALSPNELDLGMIGINPIRKPMGWTQRELVDEVRQHIDGWSAATFRKIRSAAGLDTSEPSGAGASTLSSAMKSR